MNSLFKSFCDIANLHAEIKRSKQETLIFVEKINPPIPLQKYDYRTTREYYEPGDPIGYGSTKEEAISNLKDNE